MTAGHDAAANASLSGRSSRLHQYWYPLIALVRRDVKKRYATTLFGAAWTVLQPAALISVYIIVFGFILRYGRAAEDSRAYGFFMLSGMLPYLAISEAAHRAVISLREDRALFDRETFPAEVVPVSRVITASVTEAVGLVLLVALGPLFGMRMTGWIVFLPLLVGVRLLLTCGLAWVVSVLAIFVTDLTEALSLLLTIWLFMTPIFYSLEAAPPLLQKVMAVNPLYQLVRAYRRVLLEGHSPFPEAWFALAWAMVFAVAGLWFFRKTIEPAKDFL